MGTGSMIRLKSITGKLLISYLVVVVCSIVITTLSFHSILYGDLERRARMGLVRQARDIAMVLNREYPELKLPPEIIHRRPISVFFAGRPVESEYMITNPQGTIVYSSLPQQFPTGKNLNELSTKLPDFVPENGDRNIHQGRAFIAVKEPIGGQGESKGTVYTFTQISELEALNRDILLLLVKSLLISTTIAIPVALMLGRYLTRPLNDLREYARAVARRRFDVRLNVSSDDEMAELASTFNDMAAQLERYDTSLRRFFQSASHEIKTPLMSIQGYAEGIRDRVFTGEQSNEALEVISRECQRLKTIVDEMINITRLQSMGETYTLLPCEIRPVIDEVVDSLRGYAVEQGVEVTVDLPPQMKVIGDKEKLRRLFGNLLANAIRHAKSSVTILSSSTSSGMEIGILFQDDGDGFSPQDMEHAFDYFYKGPNGSTGLGLSIARIIAEEHNGTIKVRNALSGGAEVEVTLPSNS